MKKHKSFRDKIQFYLEDCKTWQGKLIDVFIIILNFLILLVFVLETYPISDSVRSFLWNMEIIIVFAFIIEYSVRLYGARNKLKHIENIYSIIDLLTILPILLQLLFPVNIGIIRLIRVFKAFRIFRFIRFAADPYFFFGTVTTHLLRVLRLFLTIFIIFFVSSGLFWQVEYQTNPNVATFGDAFYFTVVALTTVGFGDIIPISESGRLITVLMIISGIVFIPWQVSKIIKEWVHVSTKKAVICPKCGLRYHDKDASHCKSCGHIIYQEFDGD